MLGGYPCYEYTLGVGAVAVPITGAGRETCGLHGSVRWGWGPRWFFFFFFSQRRGTGFGDAWANLFVVGAAEGEGAGCVLCVCLFVGRLSPWTEL